MYDTAEAIGNSYREGNQFMYIRSFTRWWDGLMFKFKFKFKFLISRLGCITSNRFHPDYLTPTV